MSNNPADTRSGWRYINLPAINMQRGNIPDPKDRLFTPNFARVSILSREVYFVLCARDASMRELLAPELLEYYVTALLWARLLQIRYEYCFTPLSTQEEEYRRCFTSRDLNVPEPIYDLFKMIGTVKNLQRGFDMYLSDHTLPVAASGGKSGYHDSRITKENHMLFEEVPSLGVSGDCVMALAREDRTGPVKYAKFPFLPKGTIPSFNLVGYFGPAEVVTEDVHVFLKSISMTEHSFVETVVGTRLNMDIVDYVSWMFASSKAFAVKNFSLTQMGTGGTECQLIETHPYNYKVAPNLTWTQIPVEPKYESYTLAASVQMSYYTGFQLYKERVEKSHANWCCIRETDSWTVPMTWIHSRNRRRLMPHIKVAVSSEIRSPISSTFDFIAQYVRKT